MVITSGWQTCMVPGYVWLSKGVACPQGRPEIGTQGFVPEKAAVYGVLSPDPLSTLGPKVGWEG